MLGLFDFDPENSPLQLASRATSSLHDPIGRVQVNLSLLRQNTDYTLCYPLHCGESAADMDKPNGKIWIRLRKEWADVRQALFKSALPPNPPIFVTVARPIDFQLAHYTTEGPVSCFLNSFVRAYKLIESVAHKFPLQHNSTLQQILVWQLSLCIFKNFSRTRSFRPR
jgi:hypothetical protein